MGAAVAETILRGGHAYVVCAVVSAVLLAATHWQSGGGAAAPVAATLTASAVASTLLSPPPPPAPPPPPRPPGPLLELVPTAWGDVELVWQAPDGAAEASPPAGVLFLAHGCAHSAGDFWATAPGCPACLGLPEERRIVAAALSARLFVVAGSSSDRGRAKCWWPHVDGPRIAEALRTLLRREHADTLPLYALGASSGGAFVAALPRFVPRIAAICVQIMGASPDSLLAPLPPGFGSFPPSQWVHMPRDEAMLKYVEAALGGLKAAGLETEEVRVSPRRLTPDFLTERVEGLPAEVSAAVHGALLQAGLLDGEGALESDPRSGGGAEWRAALAALPAGTLRNDTLVADASPIAEELNVAWAKHEIVADYMEDTLAFFFRHATPRAAEGGGA